MTTLRAAEIDLVRERENAIIEALTEPQCPYTLALPFDGRYGPGTCSGSCVDGPCDPPAIAHFPDLIDRVRAALVAEAAEEAARNGDHDQANTFREWIAQYCHPEQFRVTLQPTQPEPEPAEPPMTTEERNTAAFAILDRIVGLADRIVANELEPSDLPVISACENPYAAGHPQRDDLHRLANTPTQAHTTPSGEFPDISGARGEVSS